MVTLSDILFFENFLYINILRGKSVGGFINRKTILDTLGPVPFFKMLNVVMELGISGMCLRWETFLRFVICCMKLNLHQQNKTIYSWTPCFGAFCELWYSDDLLWDGQSKGVHVPWVPFPSAFCDDKEQIVVSLVLHLYWDLLVPLYAQWWNGSFMSTWSPLELNKVQGNSHRVDEISNLHDTHVRLQNLYHNI